MQAIYVILYITSAKYQ